MKPQKFKDLWSRKGTKTSPLEEVRLKELKLNQSTIEFLRISGLPEEAAPFLAFVSNTGDELDQIQLLTEYYDFLEADFDHYVFLGSDGSGDPITINRKENDRIEWLDHEDYFSPRFMNSRISHLAEFLLLYRDFLDLIRRENGDDALINSNFSDAQFKELKDAMRLADPDAVQEGFWKMELDSLLAERDYQ